MYNVFVYTFCVRYPFLFLKGIEADDIELWIFLINHQSHRDGIILAIYALDFLTAQYIMIFQSANGLLGPFEGPIPKNHDFFGSKMALALLIAI